jgi:Flp pilus assembly protein TadG
MTRSDRSTSRERGSALLETAIALPMLTLVLFGIFEMGLAFARAQVLANAAREGAREASLFRTSCNAGTVRSAAIATARSTGARFGMASGDIRVDAQRVCVAGDRVEVSVEYTHRIPVISGLTAFIGGSTGATFPIRARASMLNETRG